MFLDYRPCTSESFRFSVSGLVPGLWFCVEGGGPPRWLSGKESICNGGGTVGDANSIPRSWRSPGGGNGNPLQHSCLGNPMGKGTWQATVHGVTKSPTWLRHWARTHREGWESLALVVIWSSNFLLCAALRQHDCSVLKNNLASCSK